MRLELCPVDFAEASAFIAAHHRHHIPPVGWKFGIGISDGERMVGCVTVGRPVARHFDNGVTLEVTRHCTIDGAPKNAASMLYGAAWRAAKALGYKRLVTYTLASESGVSLTAAGYRAIYETPGKSWNTPTRPRTDKHPLGPKTLWEAA